MKATSINKVIISGGGINNKLLVEANNITMAPLFDRIKKVQDIIGDKEKWRVKLELDEQAFDNKIQNIMQRAQLNLSQKRGRLQLEFETKMAQAKAGDDPVKQLQIRMKAIKREHELNVERIRAEIELERKQAKQQADR